MHYTFFYWFLAPTYVSAHLVPTSGGLLEFTIFNTSTQNGVRVNETRNKTSFHISTLLISAGWYTVNIHLLNIPEVGYCMTALQMHDHILVMVPLWWVLFVTVSNVRITVMCSQNFHHLYSVLGM
jgi:hypothetical protein